MTRASRIEDILRGALDPLHFEIENESDSHSGPKGRETHFKILVVSDVFEGITRIDRQRRINDLLKQELQTGLHALTQRALTRSEWEKMNPETFSSPDCRGGSKIK